MLLVLVVVLFPLGARRLDYFRVRRVELVGARYIQPKTLLNLMAIDSSMTIWHDLDPVVERARKHPQIRQARISRKLPGTLVLTVDERVPVAMLATADGVQPLDRDAVALPIDPTVTSVDVPIVTRRDTAVLRLLDGVRENAARLFARISEVGRDEGGGLRVILSGVTVRAPVGCTSERLAEIMPVLEDLTRRGKHAVELDLRYRGQIVARLE
ncbi:MAG TPA: FtsQ-type POTRA domain-containing protein [Gemmatimonadaceae bacterium]|nr:FtsQ-type POTRA domain-containing protein [Gemmatimonadaceae bacterium]